MKVRAMQSILALALAAAAPLATAYDQGSWLTRFGYALVAPDSSSSEPTFGDIVTVDDGASAGISVTYMLTPSVGVEVLGALPFSHDINGTGALAGVAIGETKHLPPTVSVQWYPAVSGKFQPYLGVGLNYTLFFQEETTSQFTTVIDTIAGPGITTTDIELDDSVGLAVQAGIDYKLGERWLLNAAVWNIDIETTADLQANGAHVTDIDVVIDPWVYMVGAGYRF